VLKRQPLPTRKPGSLPAFVIMQTVRRCNFRIRATSLTVSTSSGGRVTGAGAGVGFSTSRGGGCDPAWIAQISFICASSSAVKRSIKINPRLSPAQSASFVWRRRATIIRWRRDRSVGDGKQPAAVGFILRQTSQRHRGAIGGRLIDQLFSRCELI